MGPPSMGYDRAITIWSPDGRLYQVEYALETVRKGSPTLGIRTKEGIVLAAERRVGSPLTEITDKILRIDEHIGISFSGFFADGRILIDKARIYAQIHRLVYDEPIGVETLAKRICDILQIYTQHGGVRPFGVALLIGGVDEAGPQLIGTDPSGAYQKYYAHAIGAGDTKILEVLTREYKRDTSLEEAILLSLKALGLLVKELTVDRVEMAVIDSETRKFKKIPDSEKEEYIKKLGLQ
ncbi:MAG: proteasome endopeptidase complex, archaeal, alpha subunit [Thermoprotei archaeon]|nr:MAG: proteasome endopeptidase complex, archaeal, alpha subunit [Thermoprotei archaeon]